jgi:hypothetical protein
MQRIGEHASGGRIRIGVASKLAVVIILSLDSMGGNGADFLLVQAREALGFGRVFFLP